MELLITSPFGLGSLLAQELKKLWFQPYGTFASGSFLRTDMQGMMTINLRSRLANKVFIQLAEGKAETFDQLFDLVKKSDYGQFLSNTKISLKVQTKHSQLSSSRSIQSIAHKALLESIQQFGQEREEVSELLLVIDKNLAKLYLNSSGPALHQRGYRLQTGTAPIKENLAAALLLLANWRFKSPLLDPFCGSGTIAIEAALLARNIAPGRWRSFAFEQFKNFEAWTFEAIKQEAKAKEFHGKYQISAFDKDTKMLAIAKANAEKAGVADTIHFEVKDFLKADFPAEESSWLITNPPYGKRLNTQDLAPLYEKLLASYQGNWQWGYITSYPLAPMGKDTWNEKKLFNGDEECSFWWRKK